MALMLYWERRLSVAEISRRLGASEAVVRRWVGPGDPAKSKRAVEVYERNAEKLGHLVYDTVVDTLNAIRARALATSDPAWISKQDAAGLAALDIAQREWIVRVLASFRPAARPAIEASYDEVDGSEPAADHLNGAVDRAD